MTRARAVGHRTAAPAILAVGGGALAVAVWIGGDPVIAIGLLVFYALAVGVAYVWAGRDSDVGAIMRAGGLVRPRPPHSQTQELTTTSPRVRVSGR